MAATASTVHAPRALRASVAASMAGKAAEMVTLLLLATVVPRVLGPADYGRFAVPLTIVTVGSLAMTLGGPTVMARFVPAAAPEDRVGLARALGVRLARGRALQLGAIAALVALAVVVDPAAVPPLDATLVVLALALNVAATLGLQVGLGLGRTGAWSLRYPAQNAVLIVAVLALHDVADGTGSLLALVAAALVAVAVAAVVVAPVATATTAAPAVPIPPGAIRFGALQAVGAALVQLTHRGPVLAVALLAGSSVESGYAALAVGIALGVTYAVLQAFTVSLPHVGALDTAVADPAAYDAAVEPAAAVRPADEVARSRAVDPALAGANGPAHPGANGPAHPGANGPVDLVGGAAAEPPAPPPAPVHAGEPDAADAGHAGRPSVERTALAQAAPRQQGAALPPARESTTREGEAVLRRLAEGLLVLLVPAAVVGTLLLDRWLSTVFGPGYEGAAAAFVPALATMVLAPLTSLLVQVSALRLRPEVALAAGVASAALFLGVAVVAVPAWGASGGTTAALVGTAAGAVVSLVRLPGAAGGRLIAGTAAGAAAVLLAGAVG